MFISDLLSGNRRDLGQGGNERKGGKNREVLVLAMVQKKRKKRCLPCGLQEESTGRKNGIQKTVRSFQSQRANKKNRRGSQEEKRGGGERRQNDVQNMPDYVGAKTEKERGRVGEEPHINVSNNQGGGNQKKRHAHSSTRNPKRKDTQGQNVRSRGVWNKERRA